MAPSLLVWMALMAVSQIVSWVYVAKCSLEAKLTKTLQVSSFNPTDMKNTNNFFNFVNQWQSIVEQIDQHFQLVNRKGLCHTLQDVFQRGPGSTFKL